MVALIYTDNIKTFGYITIVIYLAVIVEIIYFLCKRPWCRSYIGFSALAAASASMLTSILGVVVVYNPMYTLPPFNLFFSLSNVCMFLPALIGFHRISQQKKSEVGQFLVYAGYGWSMAVASAGATLATFTNRNTFSASSIRINYFESLAISISYLNGGFVILLIVYMCMTIGRLKGFPRRTFITFVFCFVLQAVGYSVITNTALPFVLIQPLMLPFFIVPRAICMCMATLYGHIWTLEYEDYDYDDDDDSFMDGETA